MAAMTQLPRFSRALIYTEDDSSVGRSGRGKKTSVNASHGLWLVGFFCACLLIGLMVFAGLLSLQIYCSVNKMEGFSFEDATTTGKNQTEGFYGENGCLGRRILFLNWEFVNKYT
ncbi:hypothetical protein AVEN_205325-1, partial [Araneus ventricosus]